MAATGQALTDRLQQLEKQVLSLGYLVEGMLIEAVDLLRHSDLAALEHLGDGEREVHKARLAIEMDGLHLLAGCCLLNSDLWVLVAMVEISAELERLSGHAQRVARANYVTIDMQLGNLLGSLYRLAVAAQSLLAGALDAFARRDVVAARTVAAKIDEVEDLYQQIRRELLVVITSKSPIANQAIFLSRSAYHLRRAAEHVAAICEWVLFTVQGSLEAGLLPGEGPIQLQEERLTL